MAITLEANYSKKLGLPAYSSHQYAITVRTEVSDLSQVQQASSHLYRQLQEAVDRDIQATGFLPSAQESAVLPVLHQRENLQPAPVFSRQASSAWACSPKQWSLIERLMQDHSIARDTLEALSQARFQAALSSLNKMQASGLIDELISSYGSARGRSRS